MEKGYFPTLLILLSIIVGSFAAGLLPYQCPSSSGTLVSDRLKVSTMGDIAITDQQSYCYVLTLPKRFTKSPNTAVSLSKFSAQPTNNMYLSIKPMPTPSNGTIYNSQSLTTISFSVNLYQMYTKWTLVEFYFLAEDRVDVEAGYLMVDGGILGRCDSGKSINVMLPYMTPFANQVKGYVFLNGFEISAKTTSALDKFSPLEVQLLNKRVGTTGISLTVSVTSSTQIHNLLISYVAFQQNANKVYGNSYTFQNYDQFPTASPRSVTHTPQIHIDQLWARINGLTGFIINSNPNELSFDSSQFTTSFDMKVNNFWKYFSYEYVFFLGGLCSDCEGYNIYYLGQCVRECPPQTVFNGYTCISCGQSQVWNGTHCISRCGQGKVWVNGICQCPDNTEWNAYACVSCNGGKVWNALTRNCACSPGTVWNGVACMTCDGGRVYDAAQRTCVCPFGTTWNGLSCSTACPTDQFYNTTIQQCQCPTNLMWNGTNCISCTGGRFFNSYTSQCECQTGTWNGYSCQTVNPTNCQNGMVWNSLLNLCQCPKRTYLMNGRCVACGSIAGDMTRVQCRCTSPNSFWNGYDCTVCDKQRVFDSILGTCTCPAGLQWNGIECVKSVCPKGYDQIGKSCFCPLNTNEINGQCVPSTTCNNGMIWNNLNKRCQQIQCQPGTYWDGEKCASSSTDPKDVCPFSTYWNGFCCASYSDTCPQGTQWTGDFCQTIEKRCQSGMYWTGSTCAVIPSQCPSQLTWNQQQNRCVPTNSVCPSNTYFNGYSCMPYSSCKNGQIWSNILVQCVCPDNSFWNGASCISCVGGMLFNGLNGCYCPLGMFFNGTACSAVVPKDCLNIPYSMLNGQTCDCLPGFDKVDNACVCKGVLVGLNECDKCTLKPNSVWNGFVCQCNVGYVEVYNKCKLKNETSNPTGVVPGKSKNQCSVGTYFDGFQQKCLLCSDGCLSCKNCYECQQCRPEYTYFAASKSCVEICGDGKRFSLQCDDGNNVNDDGCSSDCKIEPEYTCNGGSPNSKDTCTKYKPVKLELLQTGQTHLFGKIILNVMLNYLPTNLTTNIKECNQSCDRILLVKLVDGHKTFLSINSKYIKGSSFSFGVEIDFGREPIGQFTAEVSINQEMKDKYFAGIDTSAILNVKVNPAYLALVTSRKNDKIA